MTVSLEGQYNTKHLFNLSIMIILHLPIPHQEKFPTNKENTDSLHHSSIQLCHNVYFILGKIFALKLKQSLLLIHYGPREVWPSPQSPWSSKTANSLKGPTSPTSQAFSAPSPAGLCWQGRQIKFLLTPPNKKSMLPTHQPNFGEDFQGISNSFQENEDSC